MVSFLEIIIYLVPIAVGILMAVIGDRLGLSQVPSKKVKLSREASVAKIKGIKPETAKELSKHKINTVEDLVKMDKKKLKKIKGVDKKLVKDLVKFALKQMMED
ncbi:MAG: helix-hairpin-helix domain-containing protein [Candidatus Jordarchaeaceae archaeon]